MSGAQVRINLVTIASDLIKPNPWNPNEQTDFVFEKERHSIRTHGFITPILVRELADGTFQIIDGEHRWRAAQMEGLTSIPSNNLGVVTDRIAKQLTIIMNETRGQARRDKLAVLMKDLSTGGLEDLYENLPYQGVEIDSLINQTQIDWTQIEGVSPAATDGGTGTQPRDKGSDSEEPFRTVSFRLPEGVADQLEDQVARFKRVLHPEEDDLTKISPVMALEAMVQHLAQIPNDQLL